MKRPVKPIAIVQGAEGADIQRLLTAVRTAYCGDLRLAGVIEESVEGRGRRANVLRNVASGQTRPVFQELGTGAAGCALDPGGIVGMCGDVCARIEQGADLVILSKFGKMEAESGSGLVPALVAAMERGVPVLTSVSPRYAAAWDEFASPLYEIVPPDPAAIDSWVRAVCALDSQG